MSRLQMLFDYQKIAENENLNSLISETEGRYGMGADDFRIDDNELDLVAGGRKFTENVNNVNMVTVVCPKCGARNIIPASLRQYTCISCRQPNSR